jgi:hypothetical protein
LQFFNCLSLLQVLAHQLKVKDCEKTELTSNNESSDTIYQYPQKVSYEFDCGIPISTKQPGIVIGWERQFASWLVTSALLKEGLFNLVHSVARNTITSCDAHETNTLDHFVKTSCILWIFYTNKFASFS